MVRKVEQAHRTGMPAQQLGVVRVKGYERVSIDGDLVRECAAVARGRPPRQRDALVKPEQRLPRRRLVLDDDLDVGDLRAELGRERRDGLVDQRLEVWLVGHDLTMLWGSSDPG